jgi:hypothetical protein
MFALGIMCDKRFLLPASGELRWWHTERLACLLRCRLQGAAVSGYKCDCLAIYFGESQMNTPCVV